MNGIFSMLLKNYVMRVGRHSGRTEKQILEDEAVMQAFYHGRPFDPFGIKMGDSKNDK